jgi:hypothetical protein
MLMPWVVLTPLVASKSMNSTAHAFRMRRTVTRLAVIAIAAAALIGLAGCSVASGSAATSPAASGAGSSTSGVGAGAGAGVTSMSSSSWMTELESLPVKAKLSLSTYKRVADFGPAWTDVSHDGCDPRNDVLKRDLTAVVLFGSCKVTSGTLHDPYTGKTIHFVRGAQTSAAVQIDHLVPLANAWVEGAQSLTFTQREQFANDPIELLAVDGPTNESKGDDDASQWLPQVASYRCTYVEKQILVKVKYHLWVTQEEHDAIAAVLATCSNSAPPKPAPAVSTDQTTAPAPVVVPVATTPTTDPMAPPAPTMKTPVSPGGYCTSKGATGDSKTGTKYTCGLKGPDASGRLHWNS